MISARLIARLDFFYRRQLMNGIPTSTSARFCRGVIRGLDLSAMVRSYRGSASASYHPAVLFSVLVFGYATGVFSSRKLECGTYGDGLAISKGCTRALLRA